MTANAPHGTTSEHSTCGAESISRITVIKEFISSHVIVVFILGKSNYEFVARVEPCGISSELISVIAVLVCWKRVYSSELTHKCWRTGFIASKQHQCYRMFIWFLANSVINVVNLA